MSNAQGINMNGQPVVSAGSDPSIVVPVNVQPVSYDGADDKEKVGGKCCGCCCDFRRAVIIINGILVVVSILSMIFALAVKAKDNSPETTSVRNMNKNS